MTSGGWPWARPVAAVAALAVVALACSGPPASLDPPPLAVDGNDVARLVGDDALGRFTELRVGVTSCPSRAEVAVGSTFSCTVDVEGVAVPYEVTVTAIEGDEARYRFGPTDPVVDLGEARSLVRSALGGDFRDASVDCGAGGQVAVVPVGESLTCVASEEDPPRRVEVEVVVEDESGTLVLSGDPVPADARPPTTGP